MALTERQLARLNELVTMADSVSEGIAARITRERAAGLSESLIPHPILQAMGAALQDLSTIALAAVLPWPPTTPPTTDPGDRP